MRSNVVIIASHVLINVKNNIHVIEIPSDGINFTELYLFMNDP